MTQSTRDYTVDHHLSDGDHNVHHAWDNSLSPALTVEPGEVGRFEWRDGVDGQIDVGSTVADVPDISFDPVHPLTGADEPMHGTTGIDPDLMEATKKAVRHMITHLHEERGLSRSEAYILCSAIVDLKINEVVDAPNWTVSAYLPESIFPE